MNKNHSQNEQARKPHLGLTFNTVAELILRNGVPCGRILQTSFELVQGLLMLGKPSNPYDLSHRVYGPRYMPDDPVTAIRERSVTANKALECLGVILVKHGDLWWIYDVGTMDEDDVILQQIVAKHDITLASLRARGGDLDSVRDEACWLMLQAKYSLRKISQLLSLKPNLILRRAERHANSVERARRALADDIMVDVAKAHGLSVSDLSSVSRLGPVCLARHEAMWLLHMCLFDNAEIGKMLNRNHSTVGSGIKKHEERIFDSVPCADSVVACASLGRAVTCGVMKQINLRG